MTNIRDIFAKNLRESRRKCGFTQAKLAEKANISIHYLAMIELSRNFPKGDIIERLATVLEIEIYELFLVPQSPAVEIRKLYKTMIAEVENVVQESVEKAFEKRGIKLKRAIKLDKQ